MIKNKKEGKKDVTEEKKIKNKKIETGNKIKKELSSITIKKPSSQKFYKIRPTKIATVDILQWKKENKED